MLKVQGIPLPTTNIPDTHIWGPTPVKVRLQVDLCHDKGSPLQGASPLPRSPTLPPTLVAWEPPPPSIFKLNFDGSLRGSAAATGIIIRNHHGSLLQAKALNLGHPSILFGEASTLHQGLILATQLDIRDIIVEGENLQVINAIKILWSVPWKIANIIEDSKILLKVQLSSNSSCFEESKSSS
ncbi:uncharacterized protein [Spinacia oleracea]|uniref:RNase H type-1 domain-containing protein n=1 Tax=Spinacia oleracea TaxID=3562 RepID=A0ABM3QQ43_SPIOL|nr:uncharacterized protein LOC130461413 [Spinacia oleracea]